MKTKNWGVYADGHTASIIPHNDLIDHTDEDCTCGPRTEPVENDDGSINWIHVHHSLDGRELQEAQ